MDNLLTDDRKYMLLVTVTALKKMMAKHWHQMAEANVDLVLKAVYDLACVCLRQHVTAEGADVTELTAEIPIAWEFLCQLPERKCKQEVRELVTTAFDHLSEVHVHMSSYATNISLLAKIADPEMFDAVLKAIARPLIQINILERFLSPISELKLKMTADERLLKLEKVLLPNPDAACLKQEPENKPTRLLAAAVWLRLKQKYFNAGTAKEACRKYLGGTTDAKKSEKKGLKERLKHQKSIKAATAIKEGEEEEEEEVEDDNIGEEGPRKKNRQK